MKKILTTLLLTILVSLSTIFCISATEEAPIIAIEQYNLSFNDTIYTKYAVKTNLPNTKLLVWTSVPNSFDLSGNPTVLEPTGTQLIEGKEYTIFTFKDLAAKNMIDDVYARAYAKSDGTPVYSGVKKYSILRYAYNKLGKTGTATTNEKLKTALTKMPEYGSAMQNYLNYRIDRLADAEYFQIKVNGGTIALDGAKHGLYLEGENVDITAPATNANGMLFSH